MRVQGRMAAWLSVGALAAAGAGAALGSVRSTAGLLRFPVPPTGSAAAASRLGRAVRSDLAAGSFVAHMATTTVRPRYAGTQHLVAVYQAPDRSELIGPGPGAGGDVITVGDVQYSQSAVTSAGPQWVASTIPAAERGASPPVADLVPLEYATGVVAHGDTYRMVQVFDVAPGSLAARSSGVGEQQLTVTATVSGGRVVEEVVAVRSPRSSVRVVVRYGRFGTAPAITVPAHALILAPPPCPPGPSGALCHTAP